MVKELFPGMIGQISIPIPDFLSRKLRIDTETIRDGVVLRMELAEKAEGEAHDLEVRADVVSAENPELAAVLIEAAALDRQVAAQNLRNN